MASTDGLLFTNEHEWVRIDGTKAFVGITDYAQSALGDIVFVELPKMGAELKKGGLIGTIESVKTVSDVFSPVTGKVVEINSALEDAPESVNSDPYGSYIAAIEIEDAAGSAIADGLMDKTAYDKFCGEER